MNRQRVLFLDFDGVMNSVQWAIRTKQRGIWGIDPDTIPHLQRIVDETDCVIVVSSTWRIGTPTSELRGRLIAAGMRHPCPVVDRTPVLRDKLRGDEVAQWLEWMGPDSYVCLDDDSDFLPGQNLVKTDGQVGLTAGDADMCISILCSAPQHGAPHDP